MEKVIEISKLLEDCGFIKTGTCYRRGIYVAYIYTNSIIIDFPLLHSYIYNLSTNRGLPFYGIQYKSLTELGIRIRNKFNINKEQVMKNITKDIIKRRYSLCNDKQFMKISA